MKKREEEDSHVRMADKVGDGASESDNKDDGDADAEEEGGDLDKNELFELVLWDTGGFGRFQWTLLALSVIATFSCAFNHLSTVFTAFSPTFTCSGNNTEASLSGKDLCLLSENLSIDSPVNLSDLCLGHEVSFDTTVMRRTVITDFGLVCDHVGKVPIITSSYMAGVIIFNLLAGTLSDRFGRRRTLLLFSLIHVAASFLTTLASNYWFYIFVRFFVGGTIHGVWSITFVVCSEITVKSRRGITGGVLNVGWNIGIIVMSLLAYLIRDWVFMQLSFAIFASTLVIFYFLVPESPRWLLLNSCSEEAKEVYEQIARLNGAWKRSQSEATIGREEQFRRNFLDLCNKCKHGHEINESSPSSLRQWFSLLSSSEYCLRLFLLLPPWFAVGMSAYGIHFSVSLVQYDIFVVTVVKELVTVVSIFILMLVFNRYYRSPLLLMFFLMDGVLGISFFVIPTDATTTRVIVFIFTQALINSAFFLVDSFTPEFFSTDTRNASFALLDSLSKIGTTIAPFVVALGSQNHPDMPIVIFGSSMAVAALVFLFTQETKDRPLLQTVRDLERQEKDSLARSCLRKLG